MIRMSDHPLIALLTDYGTLDPFAGILKGVIGRIAPRATMVDITHEIPPGDVQRGAIILWQAKPYFTHKTIFLAVVDPGVGTGRRAIIVETETFTYVGPDNGLFTFVTGDDVRVYELINPAYKLAETSVTFDGRDIFAPAAAYIANGVHPEKFGPIVSDLVRLPPPKLYFERTDILHGELLHADRFGNYLTSLGVFTRLSGGWLHFSPWLPGPVETDMHTGSIELHLSDGKTLKWVNTFQEVPDKECAVLLGSSGLLEIVANMDSAANLLNLSRGDEVILKFTQ